MRRGRRVTDVPVKPSARCVWTETGSSILLVCSHSSTNLTLPRPGRAVKTCPSRSGKSKHSKPAWSTTWEPRTACRQYRSSDPKTHIRGCKRLGVFVYVSLCVCMCLCVCVCMCVCVCDTHPVARSVSLPLLVDCAVERSSFASIKPSIDAVSILPLATVPCHNQWLFPSL